MKQKCLYRWKRSIPKSKKILEKADATKRKKYKKYMRKIPLFHEENIEKELNNIFEPTVKLKSGGYLVINPTVTLVAIDINSDNLPNK